MCYSALVWSDYRRYTRDFKAKIGIKEFYDLFVRRANGIRSSIPRAVEAAFSNPQSDEERSIKGLIEAFKEQQVRERLAVPSCPAAMTC